MAFMTPALAIGLAGMAASTAGTVMSTRNRNKAIKSQQNALRQGQTAVDEKRVEAKRAFQGSLDEFTRPAIDERAAETSGARIARAAPVIENLDLGQQRAGLSRKPRIVGQTELRETDRALEEGGQQAKAFSQIAAGTDQALENSSRFFGSNRTLKDIGADAAAAARQAQIEGQAAFNNKFNPGPGQVVQGLGGLATMFGLAGGGNPGPETGASSGGFSSPPYVPARAFSGNFVGS